MTHTPAANGEWAQRDLAVVWHPCTQMHDHQERPPVPIRRGHGVWLEDFEGNRFIDGISSWWVTLLGHAHPAINRAVTEQMEQLEHVLLAGFTHEPVIRLSETLVARAPSGLTRCFYADSGSAAVEIALKMSLHYWRNCGRPRKTQFLSLEFGYHGETLGALALSDLGLYRAAYEPMLPQWRRVRSPAGPADAAGDPLETALAALEEVLAKHADELAAFVLEPLIQCAGGMRMYPPAYLSRARALCSAYDVLLIADEVAVGFGRTGSLFACEQASITPDLLCLGKGLSGGYLPLSVCLATEAVYQAFYGPQIERAFLHSHSFTG
ncbi:MAG TPA: adenosylmethionine--8-amino-7-oxononanoate transaminase, partial [Acidiferrobacteraceae bacterium]|nr:adenosylmethionine--8-amino-7-oxononanoate transaminase [Acidiferrobacteraceae bacterium]